MTEFLMMGGYGPYVWSSYAIALVVMMLNLIGPLFSHKQKLLQAAEMRRVKTAS